MAVSTSSYFSDSICGQTNVGADFDIFDTSSNPKYTVGLGFTRGDGAKFRYGHFGEIITRGTVLSLDVSESNQACLLKGGALAASLIKSGGQSMNNNAVGSRYAQLVITASADQYAGGYLTIESGTGVGFTYHIRGNDATSAAVSTNSILELYEPIQVALDSNSEISICGCPYANLESATTADCIVVGVSVQNHSSGYYGWVQTAGIVGVLQDANIGVVGKTVSLSTNTSGAIQVTGTLTGSNLASIGYLAQAGSSTGYSLINLQLE